MPRFGRIQNNIIMEIIVADELPEFHPEVAAAFQVISDEAQENWVVNGNSFSAPVFNETISPLDQLKALFLGLPLTVRASFSTVRSDVLNAIIENDIELALYLINAVQVPTELQTKKDQMIQLIERM